LPVIQFSLIIAALSPDIRKSLKNNLNTILRIALLIILAGWGYFWATGMMDVLFAYRSPLQHTPPQPGEVLGEPLTSKVVLVIIDALRKDTSLKSYVMPNLSRLRQKGAWATMHSQPPSFSQPGYSTILTGAWPEINDSPVINVDTQEIQTFTQDDIFSAAKRSRFKTAISAFDWFGRLLPSNAVDISFYTPKEDQQADLDVMSSATPWLPGDEYQLILIHLDQLDYSGHYEGGPIDPRWDAAAKRVDGMLGDILSRLDLNVDTLMVISDHGQIDLGGHGGQDAIVLIEPFILAGRGVKPGKYSDVQMVDVAPTLAALLGTSLPASSQGTVLTDMLLLTPGKQAAITKASTAQQSQLVNAYRSAVAPDQTDLLSIESIRSSRLNSERLPRILVSILLIFLPLAYLLWKRNRALIPLLNGALFYIAVFNLRIILIDERTYSLSSMGGVSEAISYFAITSAIAMLVACAVVISGQKLFLQKPGTAFKSILDFCLLTIFLLFIPVLFSYALNGWKAAWTLPEFNSVMFSFINTLQILFVSILGIVMAGTLSLAIYIRNKITGSRLT
jgi:hypothetical protein